MKVLKNKTKSDCDKSVSTQKTTDSKTKKINKHEIPKSVIEECLSTIG
ncbi:hypothetical protein [Clostridium grantii]|uniref:Uncharacterized protein n=1 Tax=Clostridium grantii DSM 8605 TaxID=1121316 RepID=A0A1M5WLC8_9CLOT|nr:hypothetical protein [Clostridium grantii]SHH87833.1 hypothetical protein SAMN02745207_02947 [Clostridium grantii DSM 8605]